MRKVTLLVGALALGVAATSRAQVEKTDVHIAVVAEDRIRAAARNAGSAAAALAADPPAAPALGTLVPEPFGICAIGAGLLMMRRRRRGLM